VSSTPATILIVDDEAHNRRLLEALLHAAGYATESAADADEALAFVARRPPDLILLDVMMPGIDGNELARMLKSAPATASIPIIMVTANSDRAARLASLEAGAEDFLGKPVDRAELWLRVRNLLRVKNYADLLQQQGTRLEEEVRVRTADLQRFRTAMDATADGIFLVECASMRFVEVNATACALFGYTREELLALGPGQLAPESGVRFEDACEEIILKHARGAQTEECLMVRKDGSSFHAEVSRQAQLSRGQWIIVEVVRDITERVEAKRQVHHLANFDRLTHLPNRALFYETLAAALSRAAAGRGEVVVALIDLDHFKNVNDLFGHAIGDELLLQFSDRLVGALGARDTVGRLSGDEFALILSMRDGQRGAVVVADRVRELLRRPFLLHGHAVTVPASIGISVYPADAPTPELLIKYAETAMYQAKQAGRDTYRFFTAEMNDEIMARLDLEAALRVALERGEFELFYQPKARLASGRMAGVEALLRWHRPGHGMVGPDVFIPVLEESGLIVAVGRWVLGQACRQALAWSQSPVGPVRIAVNVSARQLAESDLVADLAAAIAETGVAAELLELELTEGSMMANIGRTHSILASAKELGVEISIDDFGTGYSSLAYLRRFPIDKLKIDIAFIRDVTSSSDAAAIVLAILRMAQTLKLETIAEGVETAGQLEWLRDHGCDLIQGYLFSRPLPGAELAQLVMSGPVLPAAPAAVAMR
jgi:diguanylate cyclase (GGDEF)-like protein/PAS domain S-box-containing protein